MTRNSRWGNVVRSTILTAVLLTVFAPGVNAEPASAHLMAVQYFDVVLLQANGDAIASLVAPQAVSHTPEGTFEGSSGLREFATILQGSFSEIQFSVGPATHEGDLLAAQWSVTGIHTGTYQGLEPKCSAVAIRGLLMLRFGEAQIVEQWIQYDRLAVIRQIEQFAGIDPALRPGCAT